MPGMYMYMYPVMVVVVEVVVVPVVPEGGEGLHSLTPQVCFNGCEARIRWPVASDCQEPGHRTG